MILFPFKEKTLVSSFSKEEVIGKIARRTQIIGGEFLIEKPLFNGKFSNGKFRLSRSVNYSQNYLPLVKGQVEDTSLGSIVFLKLRLFPAAKLYLIVFSSLSFIIGLIFLLLSGFIAGGIISFAIGAINYILLTVNFQRKAEETISTLETLLDQ